MKKDNKKDLRAIVARRTECFRKRPDTAVYKPKVSSKHVKNLYTETKIREHVVKADYGEAAGGDNKAPNPIELLLAAFAACIESAFYEFAVHEGITVTALSAEVEGTLDLRGLFMVDDDVCPGFSDLTYIFTVVSPDDEKKVRALAEKVVAHCPVVDSLIKPVRVTGEIRVEKGEKQ